MPVPSYSTRRVHSSAGVLLRDVLIRIQKSDRVKEPDHDEHFSVQTQFNDMDGFGPGLGVENCRLTALRRAARDHAPQLHVEASEE